MTTTATWVQDLLDATDPSQVGRKAATLATLLRDGFPVPDGIVLIAAALDRVLADADLSVTAPAEAAAAIDVPADIWTALVESVGRWAGTPLAVRSSAVEEDLPTASYAGLYTTVLDVAGEGGLRDAVRRCWASAFAEQVRSYRAGRDRATAGLAVLVQPMVRATAAGIAFTVDPVTGDRRSVVVEAVRGIGERLASGAASPDVWEVADGIASRRTVAESAVDAEVAAAVAALARRVERRERRPQDIEWALAGDELVLLQARPVTAMPERRLQPVPVPIEPPPGYWTLEPSHFPLPPYPLTRVVIRSCTPAVRAMCTQLGLLFETIEWREIGGWLYLRVVPMGGRDRPAPPAPLVPVMFRLVPALRRRVATCVAAMRADVTGTWVRRWYEQWQPELARRTAGLRETDLTGLTDAGLDAHLTDVVDLIETGIRRHMELHGAVEITLADLAFTCRDLLGWDDARTFDLLAGLSERSTEPSLALAGLARLADRRPALRRALLERAPVEVVLAADEQFAAGFTEFLRTHGCRALRYEAAEQNLDERPDLVLGLVADQVGRGFDPARTAAENAARRQATAAEARAGLTGAGDRARFERALDRACAAYPVREDNEYFTTSAPLALLRRAALELGRRLADRGQLERADDVFHLDADEARAALSDGDVRHDAVTRARAERAWMLAHRGPASYGRDPGAPPSFRSLPEEARLANEGFLWAVDRIFGPDAPTAAGTGAAGGTSGTSGTSGTVTGLPASAGSYTGPVRVIRNESEFDRLRAGDVLVCPITSPVWSVLFPSIGALVTDTGGTLSHPAIIAREYGVPAVVATGNGTSELSDGQLVTVDGSAGTVRLVS